MHKFIITILVLFSFLPGNSIFANVTVYNRSNDFIVHMNEPLEVRFSRSKEAVESLDKLTEETNNSTNQLRAFQIITQQTIIPTTEKIIWLKENAKNLPPPFLIYLATLLGNKNPNEAFQWYLVAKIRTMYDVSKCTDESTMGGMGMVSYLLTPNFAKSLNIPQSAEGEKVWNKLMETQVQPAIALHNKIGYNIKKPYWIAYHGINSDKSVNLFVPSNQWPELEKKAIAELEQYTSSI